MHEYPVRELLTRGKVHKLWVDRTRALYGSWYEFFPRSTGGWDDTGKPVHGTFVTAARELDGSRRWASTWPTCRRSNPVGRVNRKGPNNTLTPGPEDVGSPWAIGSSDGGHDAVAPELGTLADFKGFVHRADELGLEVALDFALQCRAGPPVGDRLPGVVHHAAGRHDRLRGEPAEEYQDIYPLNFDNERAACTPRSTGCSRTGSSRACGSSEWTTPHTSRRTSGTG